MPTPFRPVLRALAALTLLVGLTAVAVHHDRGSPVITHGPVIEPERSTTTTTLPLTTTTAAPEIIDAVTITRPPAQSSKVEDRSSPTQSPATSDDVHAAIAAHFGGIYPQALAVASCESTLTPTAVSRDRANWGLFQLNRVHRDLAERLGYRWDQILDPYVNAAVARVLYDQSGGWGPWACRWAAR